jgi:lipoprotein signal peptidase
MDASLLAQTIISGALVSAVILGFLCRFAPRRARWPQIAAGVIFLDQSSKWVIAELFKGAPHSYLGGRIQIWYCTNFLQGFGATSPWLLCTTLVGVIGAVLLYQMLAERRYAMSFATEMGLALILGGVAIIAIERAWAGAVVDFLQLGAGSGYVCNFADLAALGGAMMLAVRGISVLPRAIEEEMVAGGADGRTGR